MRGCAVQVVERGLWNLSLYHIYFIHVVDGNRLKSSLFLVVCMLLLFFLQTVTLNMYIYQRMYPSFCWRMCFFGMRINGVLKFTDILFWKVNQR